MNLVREFDTYEKGSTSSVKVSGKIIAVKKGEWVNKDQDWKAILVMDTGFEFQSNYGYKSLKVVNA